MSPPVPTVVVLAAGGGKRFTQSGGKTHKLHARLGDVTVLEHVLHSVASAGLPSYVVRPAVGPAAETDGMGDSIARGVAATLNATGWLILPGDLPLIRADSLLQVAQGLVSHSVVLPFWQGQQGHPVGFDRTCRAALLALSGDVGAAGIVRAHRRAGRVRDLALNDPGLVMDVDTLEDLAQAERMLTSFPRRLEALHGER